MNGIFNRASLATYGDVCRQITQTSTGFSWTDFVKNVVDNKQTFYMDGETRKAIKNEIAILKKKEYSDRYAFEIEGLKQSLVDRLPSLRKQLEEQEEIRKTNAIEAARLEEVQAAFDFSAASMSPTPTKAKIKKKIQVTNPQGFMQVYQMWFMREGINMSMEDLEKIHKKMISYCEKIANKDGERIQSAFVKYVDDVTAK